MNFLVVELEIVIGEPQGPASEFHDLALKIKGMTGQQKITDPGRGGVQQVVDETGGKTFPSQQMHIIEDKIKRVRGHGIEVPQQQIEHTAQIGHGYGLAADHLLRPGRGKIREHPLQTVEKRGHKKNRITIFFAALIPGKTMPLKVQILQGKGCFALPGLPRHGNHLYFVVCLLQGVPDKLFAEEIPVGNKRGRIKFVCRDI